MPTLLHAWPDQQAQASILPPSTQEDRFKSVQSFYMGGAAPAKRLARLAGASTDPAPLYARKQEVLNYSKIINNKLEVHCLLY